MKRRIKKVYLLLFVLIVISGAAVEYLWHQNDQLKKHGLALAGELSIVKTDLALTAENLKDAKDTIGSLSQELAQTKTARDDFEKKYNDEKSRMDLLAFQISGIEGTVGLLEKLSKTDPELLQKYSKIYFLNENYIPETLVKINPEYTYGPEKDYLFYARTWSFLRDLLAAASSDNVDIKIISAYRSFGTQSDIKSTYKMIYGSGANQFSSDQGYSEHQLGTTLDFTTSKTGVTYSGFEQTTTYQWLVDNAHKYGFILSYPEDNKYYQFEPWHWRFVGRSLAEKLHKEGKSFYDLDQREIDQYLAFFLD